MITKDVHNKFESSWYDDRHVETTIKQLFFFELEGTTLITEWVHNMGTDNLSGKVKKEHAQLRKK